MGVVALFAGIAGAQTLNDPPAQATMTPPADSVGGGSAGVQMILQAAKAGDGNRIRAAMEGQSDPVVRRIGLWAMADAAPDYLTWDEADRGAPRTEGLAQAVASRGRRREAARPLADEPGVGDRLVRPRRTADAPGRHGPRRRPARRTVSRNRRRW